MKRVLVAGVSLTVAGLAGYLAGIASPYPGRAFAVTCLMVGLTLLAIGSATGDTS